MARADTRCRPTTEEARALDTLVRGLRSARVGGLLTLLASRLDAEELRAIARLLEREAARS